MAVLGVFLIVIGAVLLFFAAGMREYGRRPTPPTDTVFAVGEDIRNRRGDDAAASYYAEYPVARQSIAAKWRRVAVVGLIAVATGTVLLVAS